MTIDNIKQRFGIIGSSPALNKAIDVAARVAPTDLAVLISGESGVGKEVFSQIIHQLSSRKHNGFIAINCGAIPEGTIDSELFGHEKGSFTGAGDKRKGYFETVNGGTIFLDEIGEMPLATQSRLLRLLENGEFMKVGSSVVQKTDVRVVAATNVNLMEAVEKKKFREDLYYRLNTVPIEIPALRERGDDVELLFRKFTSDFAEKNRIDRVRLTEDAKKVLLDYRWPGNIRQLKNTAEQLTILTTDSHISREDLLRVLPDAANRNLPTSFQGSSHSSTGIESEVLYKLFFELKKDLNDIKQYLLHMTGDSAQGIREMPSLASYKNDESANQHHVPEHQNDPIVLQEDKGYDSSQDVEESLLIADLEKEAIKKALVKHHRKRKNAAKELGFSERTLYRKIKEYNIDL